MMRSGLELCTEDGLRLAATTWPGDGEPDAVVVVAHGLTISSPARWRLHSPRSLVAMVMTRTGLGRDAVRLRKGVRLAPKWTPAPPPQELVGRLVCPVVVVHGSRDRLIPAGEAERLYARAGTERRLDIVPAMGHGFGSHATPAIVEAVRWTLSTRSVDTRR
jgi:pimeloyl-ACP methyl ester carboxylesterase